MSHELYDLSKIHNVVIVDPCLLLFMQLNRRHDQRDHDADEDGRVPNLIGDGSDHMDLFMNTET